MRRVFCQIIALTAGLLVSGVRPAAALDIVTTVAGNGANTDYRDGIDALMATLVGLDEDGGSGLVVDGSGNIFFADASLNKIRRVDFGTGTISTIAGTGTAGFSGDGAAATAAQLRGPTGIFIYSGDYYIADSDNNCVRVVNGGTGIISTIVGNGTQGFSGDTGQALSASLNKPSAVSVVSGILYILDSSNQRIRTVDLGTGVINTVVGGGASFGDGGLATSAQLNQPSSMMVASTGEIFIADEGDMRIRYVDLSNIISTIAGTGSGGYSGDNGPATSAQIDSPRGMALDSGGNLFFSDRTNNVIRRCAYPLGSGNITTIAGSGARGFAGDGGLASVAVMEKPTSLVIDGSNNIFFADSENHRIRYIDSATVHIATKAGNGFGIFAGDGGPGTSASLSFPNGVAIDSSKNIYISDQGNQRIRKVDSSGTISTLAGTGAAGYSGDNGAATAATMDSPEGLAADSAGNVFFADRRNRVVRKIATNGTITTVAGNGSQGYSGDGGQATSAQLTEPFGVALDAAGNLYIADSNSIRKVNNSGTISTFAGSSSNGFSGDGGPASSALLDDPRSLTIDSVGNLFIADHGNHRIRKIDTGGTITTIAGTGVRGFSGDGGAATSAALNEPQGVAVDLAGNVFFSDTLNQRLRKVDTSGIISTVAGTGIGGFSGDGGVATSAQFFYPQSIAGGNGSFYIADVANNRVRHFRTNNPPIINSVTISQNPMKINTNVTFTADVTDADGDPLTFTWTATDGTNGTGNPFLHAFTTEGTFIGTLMASDGFETTTGTGQTLVVVAPSSGGAGVANVDDGKPPVVNPLNGISIQVSSSDGGVVELAVDIDALNRAAFEASTDFSDIPGRSTIAVKGTRPLHQFVQTGVFIATTSGIETATNLVKGKARKTIPISRKETGQEAAVSGDAPDHTIKTKRLKGKFLFVKTTPDLVSYSGTIKLAPGMDLSKVQEFAVGVGNITDVTSVDPKGKGTLPGELGRIKKLSIKYPKLKGTTITLGGEIAQVNVSLSMAGMSSAGFDTEGVTASATDLSTKGVATRAIQVAVVLAGVSYEVNAKVDFKMSAKKDTGTIIPSRSGL